MSGVVDAEKDWRNEVARLRLLTDEIPALLAYWDATQHCRFANRAYLAWFGVSAEAMVGISMRQLLGPLYPLNLPYIEGALRGEPQTFERVIPDPHGGPPRYSLARYVPHVVDGTTTGFFVLVSDVSTQERRFRAMMDATPIPYALNDAELNITYLNHEFVRVFGYTLAEIPTVAAWWPRACPDEAYRTWVSNEWTRRLEVAQRTQHPFEPFEVDVRAKDGTTKTVRAHASSLGGEMSGTHLVVLYDLTETRRLEREREQLQTMLAHSQRLDSIGRLAGGIAHDFNNLLSVIISYTELAIDGIRDNPPMAADLGEIMDAARRAELLTSQLLTFSRRDSKKVELVDLSQLLGRAGRMLHRVLGEEVHLTLRGDDQPHVVRGDAAQLEQVVVNLAVNARDAMPTGGALSLALTDVELDADHGLPAGAYVELAVQDSGAGMDEFTRDHIFEPFFTTKSVGKGTGLGLAMAFGVVQQCGGRIAVDTAIGKGSTFRIHLPRVVDPTRVDKDTPARAPTTATPRDQSILLVEDDAAVRRVVQRILVHAGYHVISCASPEEALAYVEQPGTHVDLLFTDIVMPRMRGTELAQRVSALAPATKILFMSGYAHLEGETSLEHPIVQKPFQRHNVLAQIAACLRG